MSRAKIIALVSSHLAIAAIAVWMAIGSPERSTSGIADGNKGNDSRISISAPESLRPSQTRKRPLGSWRGPEFVRAWKAVRQAKLATPDRYEIQRQLLAEWAKVDLSAALDAAMAEAWDLDSDDFTPTGPFGNAFREAFAKQPEEAWDLIESGRYGAGAGMLRNLWLEAAASTQPEMVASKLGALSWRLRPIAINEIIRASYMLKDPARGNELRQKLASFPEDLVSTSQLSRTLMEEVDKARMHEALAEAGTMNPRMLDAMAYRYGTMIAYNQGSSPEDIKELPAQLRIHALSGAIGTMGYQDSSRMLPVLNLAVEEGAWDLLKQSEVINRLQFAAKQGDARAVADWVTSLPPEPSIYQLIHRGVDNYLLSDMQGAREWIANIEEPMWRDRVYGEYSQQALNAKKDPAASRWALDRIQDPTFRATAEAWRRDWEKRTAPKKQ
jgi:hypothetical protein